jgi:hypothetical protein
VIGILRGSEETVADIVDAADWAEAAVAVSASLAPDFQFVGVLEGDIEPVGTFENLPERRGWKPPRGADRMDCFTVIGFDFMTDEARADGATARHWVEAVHLAVDHYGSTYRDATDYRPVVVVAGDHVLAGTWQDVVAAERGG